MRFTIRDLVWLIVVAGLALSWWATCRAGSRAARMERVWKDNAIELGIVLGTANVDVTFDRDGFMLTKRKPPKNRPAECELGPSVGRTCYFSEKVECPLF